MEKGRCVPEAVTDLSCDKQEIGRLRVLYQQQQQQQHQKQKPSSSSSSSHRPSSSRDLDSQFANLSLKQKDANSGHDPLPAPLCN
ncbi:hypothetical protein Gotur_033067 [Gossypium turneri]